MIVAANVIICMSIQNSNCVCCPCVVRPKERQKERDRGRIIHSKQLVSLDVLLPLQNGIKRGVKASKRSQSVIRTLPELRCKKL